MGRGAINVPPLGALPHIENESSSRDCSDLSFSLMPGHKRKKRPDPVASPPVALTVPTLKEHMWNELTEVVKQFSNVPLLQRTAADIALKKFR